jgi:hypothetical protein
MIHSLSLLLGGHISLARGDIRKWLHASRERDVCCLLLGGHVGLARSSILHKCLEGVCVYPLDGLELCPLAVYKEERL